MCKYLGRGGPRVIILDLNVKRIQYIYIYYNFFLKWGGHCPLVNEQLRPWAGGIHVMSSQDEECDNLWLAIWNSSNKNLAFWTNADSESELNLGDFRYG